MNPGRPQFEKKMNHFEEYTSVDWFNYDEATTLLCCGTGNFWVAVVCYFWLLLLMILLDFTVVVNFVNQVIIIVCGCCP